ncbi:hypothetical protein GCM10023322_03350 [Rugosimonospora acidiphila]|uniref:Uncharacterized protein n=1 Tax=Rugosimonospora acidiphila TaxID=556531 RepID=A0ABP9RIH6_9ACTN
MAEKEDAKIPAPLYAAAAVGDLAYQRLRKLPAAVTELRGRVSSGEFDSDRLRDAAGGRAVRLRDAAQRNVVSLVTNAQAAQERAQEIYTDLVARGEQVVRGRRVVHATVGIRPDAEADGAASEQVRPESKAAPEAGDAPAEGTDPAGK